jgi:hypothetical protein
MVRIWINSCPSLEKLNGISKIVGTVMESGQFMEGVTMAMTGFRELTRRRITRQNLSMAVFKVAVWILLSALKVAVVNAAIKEAAQEPPAIKCRVSCDGGGSAQVGKVCAALPTLHAGQKHHLHQRWHGDHRSLLAPLA